MRHPLLILTLATVIFHWPWTRISTAILNSDNAIFTLLADQISSGRFWFFNFQQSYGGAVLSWFRALWVLLFEDRLSAHASFTYLVSPLLYVWSTYFLLKSALSTQTAIMISMIPAIGLAYWFQSSYLYGNDFYVAALTLGQVLLGIRLRKPSLDLSLFQWFAVSAIMGLLFYISRMTLVFCVAFYLPATLSWNAIRSHPVLKFQTLGSVFIGFALGFSPEWLDILLKSRSPTIGFGGRDQHYSTEQILDNFLSLKRRLLDLAATPDTLGEWICGLGLALAILTAWKNRNSLKPVLKTILIGNALLAYLAFALIKTNSDATTRYLLPIVPSVFLLWGIGLEHSKMHLRKIYILLLTLLCFFHARSNLRWARSQDATKTMHEYLVLDTAFAEAGVRVILTRDFWLTNQLTFLADQKRYYVSHVREYGPLEGFDAARTEPKVGILLRDKPDSISFEFKGRYFKLTELLAMNEYWLGIGDATQGP